MQDTIAEAGAATPDARPHGRGDAGEPSQGAGGPTDGGQAEAQPFADAHALDLSPADVTQAELDSLAEVQDDFVPYGPATKANPNLVCFEIDDLIGYLKAHLTLSGIQRVQANFLKHVLPEAGPIGSAKYAVVLSRAAEGMFLRLDPRAVGRLVAYCTGHQLERGRMNALLRDVERSAAPIIPSAGQCYVILGGFWTYRGMERYLHLKNAGVCIGVYIYDIIPLSHPEFCDAGLVSDFALSLGDGLAIFDFILTISEFSAREVRRYVAERGLRSVPVEAVQLAHVLTDATGQEEGAGQDEVRGGWTDALKGLRDRRFVLSVSTIEARKNHAYLVAAWRLALQEGGDVPDLVFVGRYGWRVSDLMEQLRATQYLGGRVHVLHDLTDAELETLYQNCLYTAFPSFVEGWGLPIGESLAHGTPCVASATSSMPEVGGELVDYVDPYDLRNGLEVFRRMNADAAYREGRRAAIRTGFVPRTWDAVCTEFLQRVERFRSRPAPGPDPAPVAPLLLAGEVFRPGDLHVRRPVPPGYASRPLRLALYDGWYPIEDFGVWMRGDQGIVRFATPYDAGADIVLYLRLVGAPRRDVIQMEVSTTGTGVRNDEGTDTFPPPVLRSGAVLGVPPNGGASTRFRGKVGGHGIVEVTLTALGGVPPLNRDDKRRMSVGLVTIGYALRADATTRADLADAMEADADA